MDDDAFDFGTLTQQVKGWLRVGRFLSASMVVYLRFNCRFQIKPPALSASIRGIDSEFHALWHKQVLKNYPWLDRVLPREKV